jgi:integrase
MARPWKRLSAHFVRSASGRGRHADDGGLYLQIARGGSRSWVFNCQRNSVARAMGLASIRSVPLALARELSARAREQLARGIDPVDARKAAGLEERAARAKLMTFRQCAEEYYEANLSRWSNEKHRQEWMSSLRRFAFPLIGHLSVDTIDSGLVHKVLQPLVTAKAVTASRLRGRIEVVLDFAKAAGRRSGDNPADKTIMGHLLPMQPEKATVVHQPALPFVLVPALMQGLRAIPGTAARLLELLILSGMRIDAVRLARCGEFDLAAGVWTVPQARMKYLGRDQHVPLGPRAVKIVHELQAGAGGELLFGGTRGDGRPIGKNEVGKLLPKLLTAIGHDQHAVPHGFRSSLKDWCHELRDYPAEVVEQALGHRIKSSVERAYRRGDLFERRRILMRDWESYCSGNDAAGEVIRLRA